MGVELAETPAGVLRTLISWGDGPWIAEQLGDGLAGHRVEIAVLKSLGRQQATGRLLELYESDEKRNERESYNRRAEVGRVLLTFGDKRGIDILETLLDAHAVPLHSGEPNQQYRHNVFASITRGVGEDFGYEYRNYHPSIDNAIRRFRDWWLESRDSFVFPQRGIERPPQNANRVGGGF